MAADVIALGVSWRKALTVVREASRHHINIPLGRVLIQDGVYDFISKTSANNKHSHQPSRDCAIFVEFNLIHDMNIDADVAILI